MNNVMLKNPYTDIIYAQYRYYTSKSITNLRGSHLSNIQLIFGRHFKFQNMVADMTITEAIVSNYLYISNNRLSHILRHIYIRNHALIYEIPQIKHINIKLLAVIWESGRQDGA